MAMQAGVVLIIILAYSSPVDGNAPAPQTANPVSKTNLSPATANPLISTNLTSDVRHVRFQVEKVACSSETICWIRLQPDFPRASAERLSEIEIISKKPGRSRSDEWTDCCEELNAKLKEKLQYKVDNSYLKKLYQLLFRANCKRLYCNRTHCTHVQCDQLKSCVTPPTSTPPQSSSSPLSSSSSSSPTSSDVIDANTSTQPTGGNTATNTGGQKTGKTTIIVIVVTCLIAFLAGIGGAFLFICVRKRWKRGVQSKAADAANRDKRETELGAIPTITAPSETKADARNNNEYTHTARLSVNEHVYSSIGDEPQTKQHNTETTKTVKASRLQDRKLPTAPAPSAPPQPLAENASRDHTARAGQGIQSECSNAKWPGKEGEHLVRKFEATEKDRQPLPEHQPTGGDYFILKDENSEQTDDMMTKETEGQMNSMETSGGGDTHGKERIPDGASVRGEYYSPLNLAGRQADNSEYTALDLAQAEEKDVGASHDYLDVLSDYELSKPIG